MYRSVLKFIGSLIQRDPPAENTTRE